jgi:uncharacterized protein
MVEMRPRVRPEVAPRKLRGDRGWVMHQSWHDLLFAHWPLPPDQIRPLVPPPLEPDLFDGEAWLGIVAFRLTGVRLRGLPAMPFVSSFPEINVRTYVRYGGWRGVLFLSLDADNPLGIPVARLFFRLPYIQARIACLPVEDGIRFVSYRGGESDPFPFFSAHYRPSGHAFTADPDSLESWLTERYSFFEVDGAGRPLRCDVWHPHWQLQPAEADIEANTLARSHGITLPARDPLLHYAERMDARVWPLKRA